MLDSHQDLAGELGIVMPCLRHLGLRALPPIKSQIIANTCIPMPTGKLPFICKGNNLQK
eukprot:UN4859